MASFTVSNGDGKLIAEWSSQQDEFGDLILNNISKKTYNTIHLSKDEFALKKKELVVVNGDIYNVRLLTQGRNQVVSNKSGRSRPQPLQISLESRNKEIAIKLLNYSTDKNESNGFDYITHFDVLIDNGDNVDDVKQINVAAINNGYLVIMDVSGALLVNGQQYEIVARAVNATGSGEFSAPLSIAPSEKPAQISPFTAVEKDQMVTLTWGVSQENITYEISKRVSGQQSWQAPISLSKTYTEDVVDDSNVVVGTIQVDRTEYSFEGLVNGTSYDFKIVAVSAMFGTSVDSFVSGKIPFGFPAAMSNENVFVTDLSNNSIQVKLTPPHENGKAISSYQMYLSTDLINNLAAGPLDASHNIQFVVPNLAAGVQQLFIVSAMNSVALNPNTFPVSYTQYSNPNPVISLAAVNTTVSQSEVGQVKLSWDLSGNMGGALASDFMHAIKYLSYDLDASGGRIEKSVDAGNLLEFSISNLAVGKEYQFKVQSKFSKNNVMFVSADSSPVLITPYSKPAAPAPTLAMDEDKVSIKFAWAKPNLFGLEFLEYQWKLVAVSNLLDVSYNTVNALEYKVLPLGYGVAYKLYMKTVTKLSLSQNLTSDEFVSEPFTPYKAPSAVQELSLYPLDGAVEVRWNAPASNGGYSDVRYNVAVNGILNQTVSALHAKITGLVNEQVYIHVVPAGYLGGEPKMAGPAVVSSTYPYSDPEPPTGLSLTPGDRSVTLNWVASVTAVNVGQVDAPIISYIIFRDDKKLSGVDVSGNTYVDTCRVNGTSYGYRVVTKQVFSDNKVTYSDNFTSDLLNATPFKAPEAPQNLNLSVTSESISVSWIKESSLNGLLPPAKYRVTVTDINNVEVRNSETSDLFASFTGLINGLVYTVKVVTRAENKEPNVSGWYESVAFLSGSATPNPTPLAPAHVVATPGDQQISLKWDLSFNLSDNYVTQGFKVYKDNVAVADLSANMLSYEFTGLQNGTKYSVAVRRIAASGEISDMVTLYDLIPSGKPLLAPEDPVTVVTLDNNSKQISVTVDPNGAQLTDFIVFVATEGYAANDVLIHKASPISPAETTLKGYVTKRTSQLVTSSKIIGAYVIVVNASGKVLVHQKQF